MRLMDKEELWQTYLAQNPLLPKHEWARRMFDTTWAQAHKVGVENGKALAQYKRGDFDLPPELARIFRHG